MDDKKLREVQLSMLSLLKKFKEICEKECLTYYLSGGTALGAMRHSGFIPWDDDIDVMMPRDDYERFFALAPKYLTEDEAIWNYKTSPEYLDYSSKLVSTKNIFIMDTAEGRIRQNVWIDIFPLDGAPDKKRLQYRHGRNIHIERMKMAYYNLDHIQVNPDRSAWKRALIKLAKVLPIHRLIHPQKTLAKLDRMAKKYPVSSSNFLVNYFGVGYKNQFIPIRYFGKGTMMKFEDEEYRMPEKAHLYLTHLFGDYMKYPPREEQIPKHHVVDVLHL